MQATGNDELYLQINNHIGNITCVFDYYMHNQTSTKTMCVNNGQINYGLLCELFSFEK